MPQPGPHHEQPALRAAALELELVGGGHVVGEQEDVQPAVSARWASSTAYSPGTEISATLASPSVRAAAPERARRPRPPGRRRRRCGGAELALRAVEHGLRGGRRRRRRRSPRRPAPRRQLHAERRRAPRGSPACPSRSRRGRRRRAPGRPARPSSAARCRRSGRAPRGRCQLMPRPRSPATTRRPLGVGHDPRPVVAGDGGDEPVGGRDQRAPAGLLDEAPADSIFGPMLPAGNSPSSSPRSASDTRQPRQLALPARAEVERDARARRSAARARRRRCRRRAGRSSGPCRSRRRRPRPRRPRSRPGCRRRRTAITTDAALEQRATRAPRRAPCAGAGWARRGASRGPASGATSQPSATARRRASSAS